MYHSHPLMNGIRIPNTPLAWRMRTVVNKYYPANFTSCGNYGGCKFREVCAESPDHRKIILDEDFIREPHADLIVDNVIHVDENIFKWIKKCNKITNVVDKSYNIILKQKKIK